MIATLRFDLLNDSDGCDFHHMMQAEKYYMFIESFHDFLDEVIRVEKLPDGMSRETLEKVRETFLMLYKENDIKDV